MAIEIDKEQFNGASEFKKSTPIMVFGVGGAGGNAVAHMVNRGVNDVNYVIANTDADALEDKDGSKMKRIQIGKKLTQGRGAGNDPAVGKASAEEGQEEIAAQLEGTAMLFVTAGMGGGTGTGAAPVVAQLAKEKGILTVGVVTKPFGWEGTPKMDQALKGIAEMKKYVDALIVIPNERLKQLKGTKISILNAFAEVDNILCSAVSGIITLLQSKGYINVDFADVTMALKDSGIAHIAIGNGKGDNKIEDALDEVVNCPLLETSIAGARRGLVNLSVNPNFMMDEIDTLMESVNSKFDKQATFKPGIVVDNSLADDEIRIIVVATDYADNNRPAEPVKPSQPADNDDEPEDIGPAPDSTVTLTPSSDGNSGNLGFPDSGDIDTLLKKLNHLNGYNNMS